MKPILFLTILAFGILLNVSSEVKASALSVTQAGVQQVLTLDQDGDVLNFKRRKRFKS